MKIRTTLLCLFVSLSSMARSGDSTIMKIKLINDKINSTSYTKSKKDSFYLNLKEYEKVLDATDEIIEIGEEFSEVLERRSEEELPIKGEDLSILRGLMRSSLLITEKSSILTTIHKKSQNKSQTEIQKARVELLNYLVKINYAKLHNATYEFFIKDRQRYALAKEIAKLIDNKKEKRILKHFTKIGKSEEFNNELQTETNNFLNNRDYYLKLLTPDITKTVVLIEKFNVRENILGKELPRITYWSFGDWFTEIFGKITNFISGVFGNLVGKIRFRHGYLYEHQEALAILNKTMLPLDIIAEKTPFAATDFFIPGHFGHIAIYIGNETQLKSYGLWNHPSIIPLHSEIKEGKTILESIRSGSRMVSVKDFLEIDEITIIREKNILNNRFRSSQTLKVAVEQLNKEYDFNFDVSTLKKVVCSEVPYHAFGHKRWQTSYILGRNTISPDQIIENAYTKDSGIEFISSLKADEEGNIEFVDKNDMADNLDFDYDKSSNLYTKEVKKCRLVKVRRHLHDDDFYNHEYRYYKRCKKSDQALVYSDI